MGCAKPVGPTRASEKRRKDRGQGFRNFCESTKGVFSVRRIFCFAIVPLVLISVGISSPPGVSSNRLPVVASILPLGDFARNIGGDRVDLTIMVPPGVSPHTYEPTPARAQKVAAARVLILNGLGLEYWSEKVISAAGNPNLIVVETAEGLEVIEDEKGNEHRGEDRPHPQKKEKGNPHVWMDPINAIHQVMKIRDAMIHADPDGAEIYRANADRYVRSLQDLDKEIRETVATFGTKKLISFHAGYSYFARRYGLELIAVVERTPGREPSPKEIASIVKIARESNIKAIFAEPQFPTKAAQVIADECGASVFFLNPLGDPPDFIYVDTMRRNLRQLEKAMRG